MRISYGTRPRDIRASRGFIDTHKDAFGVELACAVLGISPSTYYAAKKRVEKRSRALCGDEELKAEIVRVWEKKSRKLYGAKKMWNKLNRDRTEVARCTVERLMGRDGHRGREGQEEAAADDSADPADQEQPSDLLRRDFTAPYPNSTGWLTLLM